MDKLMFFSLWCFGFIASFIYRKSEESGWREGGAGFESALRTNAECVTDMLLDCYDFMGFYFSFNPQNLRNHDKVT